MTLLFAARNNDVIVMAHDLKETDTHSYRSYSFKSRLAGMGVLAIYTAQDVEIAAAILQKANFAAEERVLASGDPWAYAQVIASTARGEYDAAFGGDWVGSPYIEFVVGGFVKREGAPPLPIVLALSSRVARFMARLCDDLPRCFGDSDLANHMISNHLVAVMNEDQLKAFAAFLIIESSKSRNSVGSLPWVYSIYPDKLPEMVVLPQPHWQAAERLSHNLTVAVHHTLGLPPPPDIGIVEAPPPSSPYSPTECS